MNALLTDVSDCVVIHHHNHNYINNYLNNNNLKDNNNIRIEMSNTGEDYLLANNSISSIPNEELDLLIKMERANKELENNQRSVQSILNSNNSSTSNKDNNSSPHSNSLSRCASFNSSELNSLNNDDGISKMDEISWELWNQIINDWQTWSKKTNQLREYIRKGIPIYLRPIAWQYLCGANLTDSKDRFKDYLKKNSACEKLIRRDVDRTYPDNEFFRNQDGQESLFNVMKAYSIHDPEVGYCQGSAFICGLLLIQSIPEEEAFAIFVQIMQKYNLRDIYKPNMYHLGLCMFQLDHLLKELLPDLHSHFITHAFHTSMYSSSWFLTLFTTSLPLPLVCRIFDVFLNEGFEIIFRVGLALLEYHKEYLLTLDMEGMLKYFQKELPSRHETDHDGILNRAFAIKYNQRKMKKLEKDFSILKKEEQEEQIEMRRLRGENKLLKQRIDNLEKESGNLADRLIKGQVVNAQNAECIYVLKNENQKLKDKLHELQLENENTIELRKKQMVEQSETTNEKELLHEKVNMLLQENSKLRETPDTQRLEEELVQVKMREAEAQLAIKELQKTIHVLNLEYQEFLNNRSAALSTLSLSSNNASSSSLSTTANNGSNSPQPRNTNYEAFEEELLKVKMREAETISEMKSLNLKLMQLETEKQVAYNQIKRQDDEIRKLNATISQMQEKECDYKTQLFEQRRQLDNKEAELKELNMTHKLQEAEDAHTIAELRQRVAALEVQVQELVTTGQLNDSEKNFHLYNGSTDRLDDMKYLLMASNNSLDKFNLYKSNPKLNGFGSTTSPSTPTTLTTPVNFLAESSDKVESTVQIKSTNQNKTVTESNIEANKTLNRSQSLDKSAPSASNGHDTLSKTVLKEYLNSDASDEDDVDVEEFLANEKTAMPTRSSKLDNHDNNVDDDDATTFKIADIDLSLRPPLSSQLSNEHKSDFLKQGSSSDEEEISVHSDNAVLTNKNHVQLEQIVLNQF